ncbi:MAG: DNA (cytosine-5-)-methyltransferase [Parcubacteria group bacterium]|jgi:DNA (cytosine-5)-methyltransferase 1
MKKNKRKSISLFTGAGGMDVGFSRAGFNVVWANEIDSDACNTYSANHTGIIECGDIRNYIDQLSDFKNIDLVFGGPPCQGFSVAGKMDPNDERSKLIFSFMDVIEKVNPKAFVLENVKALAVLDKWQPVRNMLFKRAWDLGYDAELVLLNATHFGVPQKRERMFFVGIKKENSKKESKRFVEYLEKYKRSAPRVIDILKGLGPMGTSVNPKTCNAKITLARDPIMRRSPYAGMLFNGAGRPIDIMGHSNTLPASMGGNRTPIIDEDHAFNDGKNWIEKYHKLLSSGKKTNDICVPNHLRRITTKEAALIQTFPNDYKFFGKDNSIYHQIGNAVPCDLAHAVASALSDSMEDFNL